MYSLKLLYFIQLQSNQHVLTLRQSEKHPPLDLRTMGKVSRERSTAL